LDYFLNLNKREQIKLDAIYQVEICLSNLPWETSTIEAMVHLKHALLEYGKQKSNNDVIGHSWKSVVEKSLAVFTALVLQSGGTGTSQPTPLESDLAKLLTSSEVPALEEAVKLRIHELLSPPLVRQLEALHILSLARLLSHTIDIDLTVKKYMVEPLYFCSHLDLTPWSNFLAVFVSILESKKKKEYTFILQEILSNAVENTNQIGTTHFLKILFANIEYFLSSVT
jgi:hypothetical protein